MSNLYLNQCGILCALGNDLQTVKNRLLQEGRSGLRLSDAFSPPVADPAASADAGQAGVPAGNAPAASPRTLTLGLVEADLPSMAHWPLSMQSRNNQMALAALAQIRPAVDVAIAEFGPERVAVVIGTSTSGIDRTEYALREFVKHQRLPADYHYSQQELGSCADMLAQELGVSGPAYVHSSACSSSAKAMASAARLLQMGLVDAVITGGVDTLCRFTVAGFSALDSVSRSLCQPMSANRNGINIGEAAVLFLMSRQPAPVALLGWGESSDGHHMSAPDPQGGGARLAIAQALTRAKLAPEQIDYINLHGTATVQNDAMESKVVAELFGLEVPCSSTKPFTGHTLGAAAAVEAAFCWLALQDEAGRWPPHLWDGQRDSSLPQLALVPAPGDVYEQAKANVGAAARTSHRVGVHMDSGAHTGVVLSAQPSRPLRTALSNSFAFGGSNACLIFGSMA